MWTKEFSDVYWQTDKFRNPERGKLVANNTRLYRRNDECICLRLHSTDIITWYPTHMVLNTGGWETHTTKKRMNAWLGPNYYVFQRKHVWYVECVQVGATLEFEDGIQLRPLPTVVQKILEIARTGFNIS